MCIYIYIYIYIYIDMKCVYICVNVCVCACVCVRVCVCCVCVCNYALTTLLARIPDNISRRNFLYGKSKIYIAIIISLV